MERKAYIDNLRWLCILLLFPYHAAMAWNCWGEGNYILLGENRAISSIVVAASPWYMPLLFLLAGISAKFALTKRSFGEYLKERSFKLLLPLLTGMLTMMPFMTYIADHVNHGYAGNYVSHYAVFFGKWTDLTGYDGGFTVGHLWFLLYLYLVSLVSIGVIWLQKRYVSANKAKSFTPFGIVVFCIAAMLLMPVELGSKSILTYWLFFLLGYYVFSEEENIIKLGKQKYLYLIVFAVSTGFNVYLSLWSSWECGLLNTFAKYLSGAFGILTLLVFGKAYLDHSNKAAKYLTASSFSLYLFHFIWIVFFQYYFDQLFENTVVLLVTSVLCALAASAVTYQIVKAIPFLRMLFGIRAGSRSGGRF